MGVMRLELFVLDLLTMVFSEIIWSVKFGCVLRGRPCLRDTQRVDFSSAYWKIYISLRAELESNMSTVEDARAFIAILLSNSNVPLYQTIRLAGKREFVRGTALPLCMCTWNLLP